MVATLRIGVFEEMCSIEERQPMFIGREVRRYPVEDDANILLMQCVNQVHEFLGGAVACGWCKVAGGLVTPRSIEWMLGHRHEFDVRETHLLHI